MDVLTSSMDRFKARQAFSWSSVDCVVEARTMQTISPHPSKNVDKPAHSCMEWKSTPFVHSTTSKMPSHPKYQPSDTYKGTLFLICLLLATTQYEASTKST